MRNITEVIPYENNPRVNEGAVEAVCTSISEFGFQQPLVVDRNGVIIVGHTRRLAAMKLGLTEVPVVVANLPPDKARAYRLADNQTATIAEWDFDKLPIELFALEEENFDLSLLGFSAEDLARIMGKQTEDGLTDPDECPEAPQSPVTQPGDLWLLGRHRLLCGDSTQASDVQRLMDGNQADLWLTDPPYGVAYEGKTKDKLTIENDTLANDAFRSFLVAAFGNALSVMKPGASFYIFHADSEGYNFRGAVVDCGQRVRQCLIWLKNSMVMGRQDYHWGHEPCLYSWKEGSAHHWYSDRKQTTVLHFNRPSRSEIHPTMKPVAMFVYLMLNSSARDGIVLDSFGGSGTTLIAAEQTGRQAYVMELDSKYVDVIVQRYQTFSGKPAVLERTGDSPIPMREREEAMR